MKKTVQSQAVENVAVTSSEEKRPSRITPMELSVLSYFLSKNYEKATEAEQACEATFDPTIINSLVNFTDGSGNLTPLLEVSENGKITTTKFADRWVLQSTNFGVNFGKLFQNMSTPALHSAFMAIATRLSEAHKEQPIFYLNKKGERNSFYQSFLDAVNLVDSCLEAQPE